LGLLARCSPGRPGVPAGQVRRSHCSRQYRNSLLTANFIDSGLGGAPTSAKKVVKPEPYGLIPCASKQGFLACRELKSTIREISALIRECRSRPLFGRSIRYSRENSNLAEKGKEGRRQMLAWPHQTSGSSEVWRKPPVRYVASMSRNRLTRPSNSDRTYQEHRSRPTMGQVSAAEEDWKSEQ
jgi:hypothetical protein